MRDDLILESIYEELLEEGLDQKIPKLLNLVPDNMEDKETYIRWADEQFDPTKNSQYITWILRMLKKRQIRGEEDSDKVRKRLTQFSELKKKPQFPKDKRDINAYKTYGDLAETLDQFSGVETKGEQKRRIQEEGITLMETLDDEELYIVTESEAGAKHFRQTEWCVSDPKYFDDYGAPYYFFKSGGNPETLLHLDSNQCKDVGDRDTELTSEQQEMMQTEKMTSFVLEHDKSDEALSTYYQRVGSGHDDEIETIFIGQVEEAVKGANESLQMFHISEPYFDDDIQYYRPEAYGGFDYDFSPYEDFVNDKDFLQIILDILSNKFDMYIDTDYGMDDFIADDMQSINLNWRYEESHYERESIVGKIESFANELKNAENMFDIEEFDEHLKDELLEKGYISSDWATFSNKVNIGSLKLQNFKADFKLPFVQGSTFTKPGQSYYNSKQEPMLLDREGYRLLPDGELTMRMLEHDRDYHPYVLLANFLRPLLEVGIRVFVNSGVWIQFSYVPKYQEDKNTKQYMREVKLLKDIDTHFNFYIDQLQKFADKYLKPFFDYQEELWDTEKKTPDNGEWGIDPNIKLPLLQMKSRKESPDQTMLPLSEKSLLDFMRKRGLIL